jgi:hypothetical protein
MNTSASLTALTPEELQPYLQLQHQIHDALRREHPEWIQPDGHCPMCEAYESRLMELLGLASPIKPRSVV